MEEKLATKLGYSHECATWTRDVAGDEIDLSEALVINGLGLISEGMFDRFLTLKPTAKRIFGDLEIYYYHMVSLAANLITPEKAEVSAWDFERARQRFFPNVEIGPDGKPYMVTRVDPNMAKKPEVAMAIGV